MSCAFVVVIVGVLVFRRGEYQKKCIPAPHMDGSVPKLSQNSSLHHHTVFRGKSSSGFHGGEL